MANVSDFIKWRPEQYLYASSYNKTEKELLKEYSRLRKIANKRVARALKNPELKGLNMVKAHKKGFKSLRGYTKNTIAKGLADVYRFLRTPETTLSGYRAKAKKTVESLQAAGFDFITTKNLKEFGDFMDTMRSYLKGVQVPSDYVAEAFDDYANGNVSAEQLKNYFMAAYDE